MTGILIQGTMETLYMVFWSTLLSVIIGFFPAVVLTLTADDGLMPCKPVYETLSLIVNIFRSFPFIILVVVVIPFTRLLVGKAIGATAAIVPLTIAAIPFVARIFESSLRSVDPGTIEAARSFGANNFQIIVRVYLKEAFPSMINDITLLIINLVGYTAMAGSVGAGGLGNVAIRFGYQRYMAEYIVATSIIIIILVQFVQTVGNVLFKKLS